MNTPQERRPVVALLLYFATSFLLHLAWEVAQMPLFESSDASFRETFLMCLKATATGDMLFMLTLYGTLAVVHRDSSWLSKRQAYSHPATWIVPVIVGVLLAVSFELWAIHAVHRWTYAGMPLVPVVQVGLTPVLQLIVIPLATLGVCRQWASR